MKTPGELASEYIKPILAKADGEYEGYWRENGANLVWDAFVAGYNRCSNDNSYLTVTKQSREVLRITPTETGFDVVIPEKITMTEAAQVFVDAVKDIIKQGEHEQDT